MRVCFTELTSFSIVFNVDKPIQDINELLNLGEKAAKALCNV